MSTIASAGVDFSPKAAQLRRDWQVTARLGTT